RDRDGETGTTSFLLTTPNAKPVLVKPITPPPAQAGLPWNFTVPADTFVDHNGDALTWSARQQVQTAIDPDNPGGGGDGGTSGTSLPSWLSFDASTRTFSGIPPAAGTLDLQVWVSDGQSSALGAFTLSIGVSPKPSVDQGIPDQTAIADGTSWSYAVPSNAFKDDGGVANLDHTLVSGNPPWMTFDGTTFRGTPAAIGSWTITVRATDQQGYSVTDSFVVTTPNAAPVLASPIPDKS